MRWLLAALALAPTISHAGSIYLCKAYSGGTFWSSVYCGQKQAVLDRIVSVPDNIPWDQQVALGEQARTAGASMVPSPSSTTTTQQFTTNRGGTTADPQAECSALSATIASIDAQSRQPLPGSVQDVLKEQRQKARDRQFRLGCR